MSRPIPPVDPSRKPAEGKASQLIKAGVAVVVLAVAGYLIWQQVKPRPGYQYNSAMLNFVDNAQSNAPLDGVDVGALEFRGIDGQPVDLKQFRGKSNVVLVVTRGNTNGSGPSAYYGKICLYCATQTSRLIANYAAFKDHNAEVVVVFPIQQASESGSLDQLHEALRREGTPGEPPFPLVLDVGLRAVEQLGIRADLSKPSTYILDKQGQVRFAYVGTTTADRPSVQSMLEQLAAINSDAK